MAPRAQANGDHPVSAASISEPSAWIQICFEALRRVVAQPSNRRAADPAARSRVSRWRVMMVQLVGPAAVASTRELPLLR
jgi:hypothetical protein